MHTQNIYAYHKLTHGKKGRKKRAQILKQIFCCLECVFASEVLYSVLVCLLACSYFPSKVAFDVLMNTQMVEWGWGWCGFWHLRQSSSCQVSKLQKTAHTKNTVTKTSRVPRLRSPCLHEPRGWYHFCKEWQATSTVDSAEAGRGRGMSSWYKTLSFLFDREEGGTWLSPYRPVFFIYFILTGILQGKNRFLLK